TGAALHGGRFARSGGEEVPHIATPPARRACVAKPNDDGRRGMVPCPAGGSSPMTAAALADAYHRYIACLNERALQRLGDHVDADVCYNDARLGLEGYRALLEDDFRSIPDLRFDVQLLVCEPPRVASRLRFDCTPAGTLFE